MEKSDFLYSSKAEMFNFEFELSLASHSRGRSLDLLAQTSKTEKLWIHLPRDRRWRSYPESAIALYHTNESRLAFTTSLLQKDLSLHRGPCYCNPVNLVYALAYILRAELNSSFPYIIILLSYFLLFYFFYIFLF